MRETAVATAPIHWVGVREPSPKDTPAEAAGTVLGSRTTDGVASPAGVHVVKSPADIGEAVRASAAGSVRRRSVRRWLGGLSAGGRATSVQYD